MLVQISVLIFIHNGLLLTTNGNEATVNVRAEYSEGAWNLAEGEVLAGRHQLSASTSDNAIVGDDSSEEIVMEAGTGTDFLAAGSWF